jgi:hypothetical protein
MDTTGAGMPNNIVRVIIVVYTGIDDALAIL